MNRFYNFSPFFQLLKKSIHFHFKLFFFYLFSCQRASEKIYLQAPTWFGAAAGKVRSPGLSIPNPFHENGSSSLSWLSSKQQQHP